MIVEWFCWTLHRQVEMDLKQLSFLFQSLPKYFFRLRTFRSESSAGLLVLKQDVHLDQQIIGSVRVCHQLGS
jgi:hypothetical protein